MYPVKKPRSRIKVWTVSIIATFLILILSCAVLAAAELSLEVQVRGDRTVVLEYGQDHTDPGADVLLQGKHILTDGYHPDLDIHTTGAVDTQTVGSYTLTYTVDILFFSVSDSRQIQVVDRKAPVITLDHSRNDTAEAGAPYEEEGFRAIDEYDGDLTDKVIIREENGLITYTVMDSSGNTAQVQRQINYEDTLPPEISLLGSVDLTITAGTPYKEPGFAAWDHGDGDVTGLVTVTGAVDPYRLGTYTIRYSVTDSRGHSTEATRAVTVIRAKPPEQVIPSGKVIYLTFDDGPSIHTAQLLEILRKYDVKATFFVVGNNQGMMRRIVEEGHSIAIHSVTHNYKQIYASPDAYFTDLRQMQQNIQDAAGVKTRLVRFPGGSSNTVSCFNEGVMTELTQAVQDQGFVYFDWNVDSNDAGGAKDRQTVFDNVIRGVQRQDISVVLQHDTQGFSVEAVEDIIKWGLENGYTFLALEETSPNCHHQVNN